ncbi:endo alpha-1,4 polygalactosaminidase [Nonomuraea dietziae]|uniref:endo alpha-1,4 polygalactosaminidase n=1 Tax=Nonomuraea dietziae TaxID=65515 RepID=UPI0033DF40E0
MRRPVAALAALAALTALALPACAAPSAGSASREAEPLTGVRSFTYVLTGYPGGRLDAVAAAPHELAIVDLSRDATAPGYFTAAEIAEVRKSGKRVLAYFEIGSVEEFRSEFATLPADLRLNVWPDWPDEHFVRYWDPRWWELVVRPRLEQAMRAGFDGVYLDTPLAYEEIDLARVPGESRRSLSRKMADLIVRISAHAKASRPGFLVIPQNSPELRHHAGYTEAIDGIGMEELFFRATDLPCAREWCGENLSEAAALRAAGKAVLATDYATTAAHRRTACEAYGRAGFAGNVTTVELDVVSPPCDGKE